MNLADERLKGLDKPSLTPAERVLARCQVAADFIQTGQHQLAREALGELWRGAGERPNLEGLDERTAAEVLLHVGALSSWTGATEQIPGAQEAAKDLISESVRLYENVGDEARAALARSDLALCYWREGAYDEARIMLERAAARAGDDADVKLKIVLRLVIVESCEGKHTDVLRLLMDSSALSDKSTNHVLKAVFHNELAIVLQAQGEAEKRGDYFDRAIIEYTAAIYHFEQARHEYGPMAQNNLAFLLYKLGRYKDAHEHLDRAGATLVRLNDAWMLAHIDETRARVLIAEKNYREANKVIGRSIQTFEKGGESAVLADAFTVQGIAWARLGTYQSSINILRRAVELADAAGAVSNAGRAAVILIEEHGAKRLSETESFGVYLQADELLKDSQSAEDIARLRGCARIIFKRLVGLSLYDRNFSLHGIVHDIEARFIEQALDEGGGSVTRAAELLGVSYQHLIQLLKSRHKRLAVKRTPAQQRRKSIMQKPDK